VVADKTPHGPSLDLERRYAPAGVPMLRSQGPTPVKLTYREGQCVGYLEDDHVDPRPVRAFVSLVAFTPTPYLLLLGSMFITIVIAGSYQTALLTKSPRPIVLKSTPVRPSRTSTLFSLLPTSTTTSFVPSYTCGCRIWTKVIIITSTAVRT
jgi:hypothetical protein